MTCSRSHTWKSGTRNLKLVILGFSKESCKYLSLAVYILFTLFTVLKVYHLQYLSWLNIILCTETLLGIYVNGINHCFFLTQCFSLSVSSSLLACPQVRIRKTSTFLLCLLISYLEKDIPVKNLVLFQNVRAAGKQNMFTQRCFYLQNKGRRKKK